MNAVREKYEQEEKQARLEADARIRAENRELALLVKERRRQQKLRDQQDKVRVNEQLQESWQKETLDINKSMLGPNRIRTDHFKGFTKDQLADIRREQAAQVALKRQMKADALKAKRAEQQLIRDQSRYLAVAEIEEQEAEILARKQAQVHVREQMAEERARKQMRRNEIKKQGFSDGFFGRFGKSAR